MIMDWNFKIIEDWNVIKNKDFIEKWENILSVSPSSHVFYTPSMVFAWIDTYIKIRKIKPLFIWGTTPDGNEVFFPLVIWHKNWKNCFVKSIIPVGYSDYDYHDPIFKFIPENINTFWDNLFTVLKKHDYDTIDIVGIRPNVIGSSIKWKKDEICPFLDISKFTSESELMSFFKTKLRGDIRRQIRRLEEQGKLEFVVYNDITEVNNTFVDFMHNHSLKWPNSYKAPDFHKNIITYGLNDRVVHFSSLNLNNKPIAWHLGFQYNNVFYYYMPAGNPDFSKYSPVKIHLFYLITNAIKERFNIYDHLRGEENYKDGWSDNNIFLYNYNDNSHNLLSLIKIKLLSLRHKLIS